MKIKKYMLEWWCEKTLASKNLFDNIIINQQKSDFYFILYNCINIDLDIIRMEKTSGTTPKEYVIRSVKYEDV